MTTLQRRNPFRDPDERAKSRVEVMESTIAVARDSTLTIGTDSLIVLDDSQRLQIRSSWRNCCGLITSPRSVPTRSIPFYYILWATLGDFDLTILHAHPVSKRVVRVAQLTYPIEKSERSEVASWVEHLLDRAYGNAQREKRIKVLVNPFGGKGSAAKRYLRDIEPIFAAANCKLDVERTKYKGHAVEIAEHLDTQAFDVMASCSGDGLPHEVFNGLGRKKDAAKALASVAVVQLPCGTGNAMSLNLNGTDSPSMAALAVVKGIKTPLDLVSVTQGDTRTLSFLSQAFGIVAEIDLGTENLRWMGDARLTYGFLARILGKTVYPADVAIKVVAADKPAVRQSYRDYIDQSAAEPFLSDSGISTPNVDVGLPPLQYGTVQDALPSDWILNPYPNLGNFYAGNMPFMAANTNFFPAAVPSDGCVDLVCINGDIDRVSAVSFLLSIGNGSFFDQKHVVYRKVAGYRIVPHRKTGYIAIDGETVPYEPYQVEVHKGLGTVLSRNGKSYEAPVLV